MRRLALILVTCTLPSCAQGVIMGGVTGGQGFSATNDPVSLVLEHKQMQTLADGTHISSTTHEYFYRDTLGRTRTETEFPMLAGRSEHMRTVTVQDPVAGVFLNWQTGQAADHREYNRIVVTVPQQHTPQQRNLGAVDAPPVVTVHRTTPAQSVRQRPEMKHEDLGMVDVQGASCKATRTTTTFPVDYFGNDRPVSTTQQQCMSQECGRVLVEVNEDPRTGTRTIAVQSISRGEPDPSLFQPPAGYTERVQQTQQAR